MEIDDIDFDLHWPKVLTFVKDKFDKDADTQSLLFIIGLRESGFTKRKYTKEEKQDLMNLAFCKVLSADGYFNVSHLDADGWPVWKQSKAMPEMKVEVQEQFLKRYILRYFLEERIILAS